MYTFGRFVIVYRNFSHFYSCLWFSSCKFTHCSLGDSRHSTSTLQRNCHIEVAGRPVVYLPGSQGSQRRSVLSQLGD